MKSFLYTLATAVCLALAPTMLYSCLDDDDDNTRRESDHTVLTDAERQAIKTETEGQYVGYMYYYRYTDDYKTRMERDSVSTTWQVSAADSMVTIQFHAEVLRDFVFLDGGLKDALAGALEQTLRVHLLSPTALRKDYLAAKRYACYLEPLASTADIECMGGRTVTMTYAKSIAAGNNYLNSTIYEPTWEYKGGKMQMTLLVKRLAYDTWQEGFDNGIFQFSGSKNATATEGEEIPGEKVEN